MPAYDQTIGQRITLLRDAHAMSRSGLGGSECTAEAVARFEAGREQPPVDLLRLFAIRLGCPPELLRDGIPAHTERDINWRFTAAEQVLLRGNASDARERYTAVVTDPAVILLPERRIEALLDAARACMVLGDHPYAGIVLNEAASQLQVGGWGWVNVQTELVRSQRLAGDLDRAEQTADAALSAIAERDGADRSFTAAMAARLTVGAQLLSVYADRGDHRHVGEFTAELTDNRDVHGLNAATRFDVHQALAYAQLLAGHVEEGSGWVFVAYGAAVSRGVRPAARVVDDCIRLLDLIPDRDTSARAIERFHGYIRTQSLSPDDSARDVIWRIRQHIQLGRPDPALHALSRLDMQLTQVMGADPDT